MSEQEMRAGCAPCEDAKTKEWYAWVNLMPPKPDDFHVRGDVLVSNPGVDPILVPKEPQGINPRILMLELYLCQRSGIWPQVQVWKEGRYDKVLPQGGGYDKVEIYCGGKLIAEVDVDEIH